MGRFCCYRCSTEINYNKYFCTWLFLNELNGTTWRRGGTVGTIDLGTKLSEPTSECGLGNRENPSDRYEKSESLRVDLNPSKKKFTRF